MAESGQLRPIEDRYEGYTVYDRDDDKIGKVDELFVDETDKEEYIGVKMGLFGMSGTTLVPMEIVNVNEQDNALRVSESKERVKDAPTYSGDDDVTNEFEEQVRSYYDLGAQESSTERGPYGGGRSGEGSATGGAAGGAGEGSAAGGTARDESGGREGGRQREDSGTRGEPRGERETQGASSGRRDEGAERGERSEGNQGEPAERRDEEPERQEGDGGTRVRRRTRSEESSFREEEEEEERIR